MAIYIRKVKGKNGTVLIQLEHKQGRQRTGIKHIGTAHNETELKQLCALPDI